MPFEEQLRRMERRYSRLKAAFVVATLFPWALFLLGQTKPQTAGPESRDVVRAKRFELVDDDGRVLAKISPSSDGAGAISTRDRNGAELIRLGATEGGKGTIATYDGDGKVLSRLAHSSEGGTFELYNRNEARILFLGPYHDGGSICVHDQGGTPMISIVRDDDGEGAVIATNRARKVTAVWPGNSRK